MIIAKNVYAHYLLTKNDSINVTRKYLAVVEGKLSLKEAKVVLKIERENEHSIKRIVTENVGFALAVKACVILLGAIGLIDMWIAVFADVGVLCLTICNAMRAFHVPAGTNTSLLQQ